MLELQKKYHDARMERDKELCERQIKIVNTQIDRRVYDLYGLTENITDIYFHFFFSILIAKTPILSKRNLTIALYTPVC